MKRALAAVAALAVAALAAFAFLRLHVFEERHLEARAFPLRGLDLQAPESSGGVEYYGKLRMDVLIGADGIVESIEMKPSTLPLAYQESAAGVFRAARWEPGRKWGLAVRSVKHVEVDFKPPSRALE